MGLSGVEGAVEDADCVLVAVGHSHFATLQIAEIARRLKRSACLIDGWRIFDREEAAKHNLVYFGVGLG